MLKNTGFKALRLICALGIGSGGILYFSNPTLALADEAQTDAIFTAGVSAAVDDVIRACNHGFIIPSDIQTFGTATETATGVLLTNNLPMPITAASLSWLEITNGQEIEQACTLMESNQSIESGETVLLYVDGLPSSIEAAITVEDSNPESNEEALSVISSSDENAPENTPISSSEAALGPTATQEEPVLVATPTTDTNVDLTANTPLETELLTTETPSDFFVAKAPNLFTLNVVTSDLEPTSFHGLDFINYKSLTLNNENGETYVAYKTSKGALGTTQQAEKVYSQAILEAAYQVGKDKAFEEQLQLAEEKKATEQAQEEAIQKAKEEEDLTQREAALEQAKAELEKKTEEFTQEQTRHKSEQSEKETELDKQIKDIEAREEALKQQEADLAKKAEEITDREAELDNREAELDERDAKLTKAEKETSDSEAKSTTSNSNSDSSQKTSINSSSPSKSNTNSESSSTKKSDTPTQTNANPQNRSSSTTTNNASSTR